MFTVYIARASKLMPYKNITQLENTCSMDIPAGIYLFKVNNENTRIISRIC